MTIILFLLSLFVLCALVGSKIYEMRVRKINFLADVFIKGDNKIHDVLEMAISKYHRYRQVARIFVSEFLPSYAYEMTVRLKDYVSRKYYTAGDGFRGRRVLRTNGSVSFFLERLSEGKMGNKSHKI